MEAGIREGELEKWVVEVGELDLCGDMRQARQVQCRQGLGWGARVRGGTAGLQGQGDGRV